MFKRKVTEQLHEWKEKYSDNYAALIEGARRVGKSTAAEDFARNNFKSYIRIDFSNITGPALQVFDDIADLDYFFLRLQATTGVNLFEKESVIIFDEIQLMPKVRQAIKHLVADGRYYYIETGSLLSIKKNVKNIVIPSEEYRIEMFPMDYEEFLMATGNENSYSLLRKLYKSNRAVGNQINQKLMRDFRLYMAVGGMPQAVKAFVDGKNFSEIDTVKREILALYKDDFRKVDSSGRISMLYDAIPSQLALAKKRFVISNALGKRTTLKDIELLADLLDSKTVLPCYNVTDPSIALSLTKDPDCFKLYPSDIGLFTTMLFNSESKTSDNIYSKLLSNKLEANLGYLYESVAAQLITSQGRKLYYHSWPKENSKHNYEIDFLLTSHSKITPVEVKSSTTTSHDSLDAFFKKYHGIIYRSYIISQKDVGNDKDIKYKPVYMFPFILEE